MATTSKGATAAALNYNYGGDEGDIDENDQDLNLDEDSDDNDFLDDDNNSAKKLKKTPFKTPTAKYNTKAPKRSSVAPTAAAVVVDKNEQSYQRLVDSICDYVNTLMHCILYKINYYDKSAFERVLKYDIIVYRCKDEVVCEYIVKCVECMRLLMCQMYDEKKKKAENTSSSIAIGLAILYDNEEASEEAECSNGDDDDDLNRNKEVFLQTLIKYSSNLLIKRYTLLVENLVGSEEASNNMFDEWHFRDSIIKCLYSKEDVHFPPNIKWQIQLRSNKSTMRQFSREEDLFKLFAWRECDVQEVTTVTTEPQVEVAVDEEEQRNKISIKPIKTFFNNESKSDIRLQLFVEQSFC